MTTYYEATASVAGRYLHIKVSLLDEETDTASELLLHEEEARELANQLIKAADDIKSIKQELF